MASRFKSSIGFLQSCMVFISERRRGVRCWIRPSSRFCSGVRGFCVLPQAASAVKTFTAIFTGPPLDTRKRLMILPSVVSRSGSASILYFCIAPFCAQGIFSSSLKLQMLISGCIKNFKQLLFVGWSNAAIRSSKLPEAASEIRGMPSTRLF